jgi:hypothetical protein
MSERPVIFDGKMNSHENYGKLDVAVRIEISADSRVIMYFTDAEGMTREAAVEINGENNGQLMFLAYAPYDSKAEEVAYPDDPLFIAKVGDDRGYAYDNYTGQDGRCGATYAMVSQEGIEMTDTMEFSEPSSGPKY